MRYMLAIAMLALCVTVFAETEASDEANVTVTIERSIAIVGGDDVEATIEQGTIPTEDPGEAAFGDVSNNEEFYTLPDFYEFTLFKNCDVNLSAALGDLICEGEDLFSDAPNTVISEDYLETVIQFQEFVEDEWVDAGESSLGIATALAEWVNCTELDGEPWRIEISVGRDGLCDHAGIYRGTLLVDAVVWSAP